MLDSNLSGKPAAAAAKVQLVAPTISSGKRKQVPVSTDEIVTSSLHKQPKLNPTPSAASFPTLEPALTGDSSALSGFDDLVDKFIEMGYYEDDIIRALFANENDFESTLESLSQLVTDDLFDYKHDESKLTFDNILSNRKHFDKFLVKNVSKAEVDKVLDTTLWVYFF